MASKAYAVKNDAGGYVFRCVLFAQSNNQIISNPTLASGDWKISIDGGAFANLATLPDVDPDTTAQVKVTLSQAEINGDELLITAIDASGDEWHSAAWVIHTVAAGYDSLSTLTAAQVNAEADTAISDAALATAAALATVDGIVDDILVDTGTTLPATLTTISGYVDGVEAAVAALNDVSSGDVQTAAAAALTAYDPPTKAELDSAVSPLATAASIAALNDITAADVLAAIEAATIDGTITRLQKERIELSVLAGKSTGGGTSTITFRDAGDSKARVTATVDGSGNRTAVTVDGS